MFKSSSTVTSIVTSTVTSSVTSTVTSIVTSTKSSKSDITENKNELEQHSLNVEDYDYDDYSYRDNYDYSYEYLERPPENVNCSLFEGPKKITEDLENKKCTEFNEEGYRCVPFYACKGGEIITNGVG